jgi:hypothetical protein
VRLIYEDDGVGISTENKKNLFTEGFSTGNSTGFGLFLSKKMMDVYGWKIQETGELGKCAKFLITIPRVNQNGKENFQFSSALVNIGVPLLKVQIEDHSVSPGTCSACDNTNCDK